MQLVLLICKCLYRNLRHGKISRSKLEERVRENFKLTPKGITQSLDLLKPGYLRTASYGHFGRSEFSWEKLDKVKALQG